MGNFFKNHKMPMKKLMQPRGILKMLMKKIMQPRKKSKMSIKNPKMLMKKPKQPRKNPKMSLKKHGNPRKFPSLNFSIGHEDVFNKLLNGFQIRPVLRALSKMKTIRKTFFSSFIHGWDCSTCCALEYNL